MATLDQEMESEIFRGLPKMNRGLSKNFEYKAQQVADFARCIVNNKWHELIIHGFSNCIDH